MFFFWRWNDFSLLAVGTLQNHCMVLHLFRRHLDQHLRIRTDPPWQGVEPSITRVCTRTKPLFLRVRILRVCQNAVHAARFTVHVGHLMLVSWFAGKAGAVDMGFSVGHFTFLDSEVHDPACQSLLPMLESENAFCSYRSSQQRLVLVIVYVNDECGQRPWTRTNCQLGPTSSTLENCT